MIGFREILDLGQQVAELIAVFIQRIGEKVFREKVAGGRPERRGNSEGSRAPSGDRWPAVPVWIAAWRLGKNSCSHITPLKCNAGRSRWVDGLYRLLRSVANPISESPGDAQSEDSRGRTRGNRGVAR